MSTHELNEAINPHRRSFLASAVIAVAGAQYGIVDAAWAQTGGARAGAVPTVTPGTHTSFGAIKRIDAGVLNVGYAEAGPRNGPAVLLLHGWPYDIHSFVDVAPLLADKGYRVIVPFLRGYGPTRFLSNAAVRNGQPAAFAADTIALMDALHIDKAVIGGFDWGGRTANALAILWPQRTRGMVSVSGYLLGSPEANKNPLPPQAELAWWYQFYFATERGRAGYDMYRRDFAKLIWTLASPQWQFDDATFERSAAGSSNATRTMWPSRFKATVGAWVWRRESPSTRPLKASSSRLRTSAFPRSPWKAMPTVPPIRSRAPMLGSSPAATSTGPSRVASATTCLRKRHRHSPRRLSTSTDIDPVSLCHCIATRIPSFVIR
jgi:pimeloyl-ACP methyl ester carboxylesterase